MAIHTGSSFQNRGQHLSPKLLLLISFALIGSCFAPLIAQENSKAPLLADSFDIKKSSFLLPQPLPKGKYSHALSIFYVVPPKDWTLDMVNAPMINYAAKYTLGKGFNLQGSLATLIVSNRFNAGPFWNYSKNNIHLGIGYQVAFNFGMLNQFGFSSTLTGWEQQPSLTFGYSFKKTALIFRGDLYYTTSFQINEGGNKVAANDDFVNGFSFSSHFEQRLHKDKVMSLGVKLNYLRYHILAWPAFPVNSYRYLFPEFQIGWHF
jgi:hypothetical protein